MSLNEGMNETFNERYILTLRMKITPRESGKFANEFTGNDCE